MTFNQLNYEAQVSHLHTLAADALRHWHIKPETIALEVYANNAVFKVTAARQVYALRLHRPGHKPYQWIRSEVQWLMALRRETQLCVPNPAYAPYQGRLADVEEPVSCVLFHWLEGEFIQPPQLTPKQAAAVGRFAGHLHTFAEAYTPAAGFERPRLDWEGLFGEHSPYHPGAGSALIGAAEQGVLDEVAERVREVMQQLDAETGSFGLIHADFIPKNTLFNDSTVCAIDFDDCGYGYYLYDLAPALLFYKSAAHYDDLKAGLLAGYNSIRPLTEAHHAFLETFVAGRYVASCRWVAGNADHPHIRGKATEIIAGRVGDLRQYLQTGSL